MEYCSVRGIRISRMTLGTAQLGLNYGIANRIGQPSLERAHEILKRALALGINAFDTAPSYGNSETIVGAFFERQKASFKMPIIITKIPKIQPLSKASFEQVYAFIRGSLIRSASRLKMKQIPIALVHHAPDVTTYGKDVTESLNTLKKEGLIKYSGVSVYDPDEVEEFLRIGQMEAIEIPVNLFDRRLIDQGLLLELAKKEIMVLARSVFLQGLFFLDPEKLPVALHLAVKPLRQLRLLSQETGVSIESLAVTFVRDLPGINSLVMGVETVEQLKRDIEVLNAPHLPDRINEKLAQYYSNLPEKLINPSLWNVERNIR
jgi:aryl-alcohol dehydrogenase-like predicted oxidoreductase